MSGFHDISDIQQLVVKEEEVPTEQHEISWSLNQEKPQESAHIKEEQDEQWICQEREQLHGAEGSDNMSTFIPVPVKSEEGNEDEPQSLKLHEIQNEEHRDTTPLKTESDGEDCGGSGAVSQLQPVSPDKTSDLSGSETDDSADWEESDEAQKGLNSKQNKDIAVSDMKCNTGDTSASSPDCAPSIGQIKQLEDDKGTYTGEKCFSCSFCKKRFMKKAEMVRHIRVHTGEKPFSCSFCGKRYSLRGNLRQHILIHTGEKPFSCSVCGKRFKQRGHLKNHSVVHTGEKPFSCSLCDKRFSLVENLKQHLIIHTGEKRFSCSVCGKKFTQRAHLKNHSVIHTGEKPLSCSICDKRFTHRGDLKRHFIVHTGEKPISCSVCGKRFIQNGDLKRHSTVHTGEKPFSCSVCGKLFIQRGDVKRHSIVHTGEKPFSCSVCERKFTKAMYLKNHKCVGKTSDNV
ncbi:gastrula zinc finger protein XlCGF57.1-like [Cheilinus undulatus]|uniref:gastrula zinc finger protein XlCGF57.1-like n=1 Tax=Cheilinus undulatus TaxID=241271 RepID=UPI001BD293EE|nr:gastrula zinc finger protein XlCGF57.1-like [Cheilinus undulatus]